MDFNALQAFTEVARCQSFSQAAEALFITQPAISKRITVLERELGVRLFNRINRSVSLTEAGRSLLPRVQALNSEIEAIRRYAADLSGDVSGILSMATSHHIGLRRLPPVLKHFNQHYPKVQLDIRFEDSEQACLAVERGELEVAIATLPAHIPEQLETHTIWVDKLQIVTAPDHPLQNQQPVSLTTLSTHPCVLPSKDTFTYQILRDKLQQLKVELNVHMSTNYIETLKMLVSSGFGWSLLPHTMLDDSIAAIETDLLLERRLGSVVHRKRTLSNAAVAMLETLEQFQDYT
ncbi:MAG: LysR family transcriptional regulator [Thiolinea sp.]